MVTSAVPAGVPGMVGVGLPPLPQPMNPPPKASVMTSTNHRPQPLARSLPGIANSSKLRSAKHPGISEREIRLLSSDACGAVVVIVRVVVTALAPGVTVAGAKLQLAFKGRPLHAKLTACAKPPAGVTESVDVPDWPGMTDRLAGLALMLKEGGGAV
jgi:hypothetical protein